MVKINHYLGAVLLITGTTIGAGMLAMPVGTSFAGFFPSVAVFTACWVIMLLSALFFLDVNLSMPGESNFITMCEKTLGTWGKVVCWITYLLLLYSLTAAYIAASAPLFAQIIQTLFSVEIPNQLAYFCLPFLFGGFVYLGTLGVDFINRFLMVGLAASFLFLIGGLPEYVQPERLLHVDFPPIVLGLLLVITAFGYHIIIPSLVTYMYSDKFHLRRAIVIGSVVPLLVYIIWEYVTVGVIPLKGPYSMVSAWVSGEGVSGVLSHYIPGDMVRMSVHFFTFFAVVTSFLGVSLALSDFLTDGFHIEKSWEGRLIATFATFVPPLLFLFTSTRGLYFALQHAGALVAVLLIFLPSAMAWTLKESRFYGSRFGKIVLGTLMVIAACIFCLDVISEAGLLKPLIKDYVSA